MADIPQDDAAEATGGRPLLLAVAWLWVTVPFLYGLYELSLTARKLFM
jgi:hypothetical protein